MSFLTRFSVAFALHGYWDYPDRNREREARQLSGYTSIRVSKHTAAALRRLARAIAAEHYGWSNGNKIPLDELLAAIAAGTVAELPSNASTLKACKTPIAEMHAKLPAVTNGGPRDRRHQRRSS